MSKLFGLNWMVPPDYLNAAALLSLFSVAMLVILFFYLNWYTGRRYFSLWTLGWVFYAAWLAMGPTTTTATPLISMIRHCCVGISAALLFWGSVKFLELPSRPLLVLLFVGFMMVWSYLGAYRLTNPRYADTPIFAVIGLASLVTAVSFYRLRKHRQYLGAGLLTFGFLLWAAYLGACPFFERDTELAATGFVISAVLQLFIAVSMIILVLEEARAANEMILDKVRDAKLELLQLARQEAAPGEEAGYQGVFDRSQLSEKLKTAYGDLREAQEKELQRERYEALGQLSRGIAHDINNALTPILGYSNLLLRKFPGMPTDVRQYLSSIRKAGEKISQSVSCIRDFYREQGGKDILKPVELNGLARDAIAAARARWHDSPPVKGVQIDFEQELDTSVLQIKGTSKELAEALNELTLNALEAMPRGGKLTVRTGLLAQPTSRPKFESERVFIEVSDTGVGMDDKTRERCLEPFFSTKEKNGARGLGLSKVYGIVQRHDAEIQMDSVRGEGTTVRLVFDGMPAGNTERFYANPSAALPPLRILCIDDEPSILDVLRMVLRSGGHQVETADDGQLGLEKFRAARVRNEPFDVVLTDLGMPRLDGQQVARTIKQESFKTPVIMLTGWGGIMQAEGTHPRDVDVVLAKPPQVTELIGALQKVTAAAAAA